MAITVKVKVLDPNATVPQQMTDGAAGFDLALLSQVTVLPGQFYSEAAIGHTGIALEIPKGYYGEVVLRSSIGKSTKIRLANQVGIIDSDYRGEIVLLLENTGHHMEILQKGARIAQLIIKKCETVKLDVVDVLSDTKRDTKGLGSTGK